MIILVVKDIITTICFSKSPLLSSQLARLGIRIGGLPEKTDEHPEETRDSPWMTETTGDHPSEIVEPPGETEKIVDGPGETGETVVGLEKTVMTGDHPWETVNRPGEAEAGLEAAAVAQGSCGSLRNTTRRVGWQSGAAQHLH